MSQRRYAAIFVLWFFMTGEGGARNGLTEIANRFLPPGAEIAELYKLDPKTNTVSVRNPAVLTAHIVSENSSDLVLAYYSQGSPPDIDKSLFVDVLHQTKAGYAKVWEGTYYGQVLIVPDALALVKLPGEKRHAVAVISGRGASLGGQLQILRWDTTWGVLNVMPENGPAHGFSFVREAGTLKVKLSFEKYPGEKGVPPPIVFQWQGNRFVRAG